MPPETLHRCTYEPNLAACFFHSQWITFPLSLGSQTFGLKQIIHLTLYGACNMTGFQSLDSAAVADLFAKHGARLFLNFLASGYPGLALGVVQTVSAIYADVNAVRASQAQHSAATSQQQTSEAEFRAAEANHRFYEELQKNIPQILRSIRPMEIRVPDGAFNSTPGYAIWFQSAAVAAIPLILMEISAAIKRVGGKLEAIHNELAVATVARVQGWATDGFGSHIHRFVRNEMRAQQRDERRHYYYVWHPDTDWYPAFEERLRNEPLPSNFGGYNTDLATLCLWMSLNRHVLRTTTPNGDTAVFHLLIPAYSPIVIEDPITFHRNLFPLVVTGQRHRGLDLVGLNVRGISTELTLQQISNVAPEEDQIFVAGMKGFVGCWLGAAGCVAAAAIFPPCAPIVLNIGFTGFIFGGMSSGTVALGGGLYEDLTRKRTQVLGMPLVLDPDLQEPLD